MTELKPCPFCGSAPEIMTSPDGFTSIGCLDCNPFFGVMVQRMTREEAVELWNTRVDDQSQAAAYWRRLCEETVRERTCHRKAESQAFICSECCCPLPEWRRDNYCPNCGAKVVS